MLLEVGHAAFGDDGQVVSHGGDDTTNRVVGDALHGGTVRRPSLLHRGSVHATQEFSGDVRVIQWRQTIISVAGRQDMPPTHRFDFFPRRPWRRHPEANYLRLRRKARCAGVTIGVGLALVMLSGGWLIDRHEASAPVVRWSGETGAGALPSLTPARATPRSVDADEFPLVAGGSVVATRPVAAPHKSTPIEVQHPMLPPAIADGPPSVPAPVASSLTRRPDTLREYYVVQLGTYRVEENAREDQDRYRRLGIDPQLSRVGSYVVLRLSPYDTLADAQRVAQEVRARGIQPVVIGPLR